MTISDSSGTLTWAHVGDLHVTAEHEPNYRDFQSIVESMNANLAGQVDFCMLPGDNASDGSNRSSSQPPAKISPASSSCMRIPLI